MARSSLKNVCRLIEGVQKDTPVERSFLLDLERSIELDDMNSSRIPSKTYKPSSMKCLRNMWYQVTGAERDCEPSNYTSIGICNSGTDTHERIQSYVSNMKNNNIDCEYVDVAEYVNKNKLDYIDVVSKNGMETKLFHKELNMSFMCDGIIKYKNHYYILELKTESLGKWSGRKSVNPEHYNQAISYSLALGINEVIFIYICRDNSGMKSFKFDVTDDMKQTLVAKIIECDDYVSRNECPPVPLDFDIHNCTYCDYKKLCNK